MHSTKMSRLPESSTGPPSGRTTRHRARPWDPRTSAASTSCGSIIDHAARATPVANGRYTIACTHNAAPNP